MNPNTMNKLVENTQKPDTVATVVKVIFGAFLLVRIIKTSVELYYTLEDRKTDKCE
ncbi:hypothetical protein IWQ47_003489 [Aquimarina sp. EL_43]|uniref:hypothetical protein n=2 Tax=Aquimarina TaxID=290174 RepID=UPI0018C901D8|nr:MULTISPECIES: hypothetical protein [unclassified Aquimarina]MBG6131769.1 hypothetical protein [Aquimarina sp. EL_35]MBG6170404.1 hypothetical protein [Aquimarina sp. EL_43]